MLFTLGSALVLRLRLVFHQERQDQSRSGINLQSVHSRSSHRLMPGLRASHLGYGLHLPERTELGILEGGGQLEPQHRLAFPPYVCPRTQAREWMSGHRLFHSLQGPEVRGRGKEQARPQPSKSSPPAVLGAF